MRRVFLDANVLFSAAYRVDSGLRRLLSLGGTEILTSAYAAEEARRNLDSAEQRMRLEALLDRAQIVAESTMALPHEIDLAEKDQPILRAAAAAGATHLVTGDFKDFGRFFGKRLVGVLVVTPTDLLEETSGRR